MYYVKVSNGGSIEEAVLIASDELEEIRRFVERYKNHHPECRARHSFDKTHIWIENEKGEHVF